MNWIAKAQDRTTKEIQDCEKTASELRKLRSYLDMLPDALMSLPVRDVEVSAYADLKPTISLRLPWITSEIAAHTQIMEDAGFEFLYSNDYLEHKHREVSFTGDEFDVDLQYRSDLEGATCVITKIGETKKRKVVVTPVFEVTCPEGASEGAFS